MGDTRVLLGEVDIVWVDCRASPTLPGRDSHPPAQIPEAQLFGHMQGSSREEKEWSDMEEVQSKVAEKREADLQESQLINPGWVPLGKVGAEDISQGGEHPLALHTGQRAGKIDGHIGKVWLYDTLVCRYSDQNWWAQGTP